MESKLGKPNDVVKDSALRHLFAEAYSSVTQDKDSDRIQEVAANGAEWCKSVSLFMPKAPGRVASLTLFALDEMSTNTSQYSPVDAMLGALKGLSLRAINKRTEALGLHPITQGVCIGLGSRLTDSALSRSTYGSHIPDTSSLFDVAKKITSDVFNAQSLTTDAALSLGSYIAIKRLPLSTMLKSQRLQSAALGSTYGAWSGALSETERERENDDTIKIGKIASAAFWAGVRDGSAGYVASRLWTKNNFGREPRGEPEPIGPNPGIYSELAPRSKLKSELAYQNSRQQLESVLEKQMLSTNEANTCALSLNLVEHKIGAKLIKPEVATRVHHDIVSLFDANQGALETVDRKRMAIQLITQVANPRLINQGARKSCYPAAYEFLMMCRHPDAAVNLITRAARTGSYSPPNAEHAYSITFEDDILRTTHEHRNPRAFNGRSYPSALFQAGFSKLHWHNQTSYKDAQGNNRTVPAGSLRFETVDTDTGKDQHLFLYENGNKQLISDSPYMHRYSGGKVYQDMTGEPYIIDYNSQNIRSEARLRAVIKEETKAGRGPIVIIVDASKPPFDNPVGGPHAICIYDADMEKDIAYVHNPWGRSFHENGISFKQLFQSLYRF